MAISVRARDDVSIIELSDGLALGDGGLAAPRDERGLRLSELGVTLQRLLEQGSRKIVIDLERVKFLDSAGLGELIACAKRTAQRGGDVRVLRPTGKVRNIVGSLSMTRILQVFDDESAAVASFEGPTTPTQD